MTTKTKSVFTATLVAFAGMLALSASAAEKVCEIVGVRQYENVAGAVEDAQSIPNATVKMLKTAPVNNQLGVEKGSNITIDLAGCTIDATAVGEGNSAFRIYGGTVKFTDSVGGGAIKAVGSCIEAHADPDTYKATPNVTIDGGIYSSEKKLPVVSTACDNTPAPESIVVSGYFSGNIAGYLIKPTSVIEKLAPKSYRVRPNWLCFTATEANSKVQMAGVGTKPNLEYSYNGEDWFPFTIEKKREDGTTITLANVGDHVFFRGDNDAVTINWSNRSRFLFTGKIAASGNVMSLLSKDCSKTAVPELCFLNLFNSEDSDGKPNPLVSAPLVPATTLSENCYDSMFAGTLITETPVLPAANVPVGAYNAMFNHCSELTNAVVSAETMATMPAGFAAGSMFEGCEKLAEIHTRLTSVYQSSWVMGVAAKGTFCCPFELNEAENADERHNGATIPEGWTISRPNYLSFTARGGKAKVELKRTGNPSDFQLEYATDPTAKSWTEFTPGKDSIEIKNNETVYLRRLGAAARFDGLSRDSNNYWQFVMSDVDGTGAKVQASGRLATLITKFGFLDKVGDYGFYKLFAGCDILTVSPLVPEDISGNNCCVQMFDGCTNLKRVNVNFTKFGKTTVKWLRGVAEKGIFVYDQTLEVAPRSIDTIPEGWVSTAATIAFITKEIPNATYVVKNGLDEEMVPVATSYMATNKYFRFARQAEDLIVELTPAAGYTYDETDKVPFKINASELTEAYYDLAQLIPQAKLGIAVIDGKDHLFSSLDNAIYAAKGGDKVWLIRENTEDVVLNSKKELTVDGQATNLLTGSITAKAGQLTLQNFYMTGKLDGNTGKVIFESGTNLYTAAFNGNVCLTNGVFGYKHADSFIRDGNGDYTMARIGAADLWTIVEKGELVAQVREEKFTTFAAAMEYAVDGDVIKFLKDYDQEIEVSNMTLVFDVNGFKFMNVLKPVDPSYNVAMNNAYQLYFTQAPLVAKIDPKVQGGEMAFTNHQQAIDVALDGQTLLFLASLEGDLSLDVAKTNHLDFASYIHNGKLSAANGGRLIVEAGTNTYTQSFEGDVVLNGGTYSYNQIKFVGEGKSMANNGTTPPTWTVVDAGDIVAEFVGTDPLERFTSLAAANAAAAGGETLAMVKLHNEDIDFTKSLTFVHTNTVGYGGWYGNLVAKDGAVIYVIGSRGDYPERRKFGVVGGGVLFDYNPSQKSVKDEGYAIIHVTGEGKYQWQLLLASNVVAMDRTYDVPNELFQSLQNAADFCPSADFVITVTNSEAISATRDFTMSTADQMIYKGKPDDLVTNSFSVQTLIGSVYKENLINNFDWSKNGYTLAWNYGRSDDVYTVVAGSDIVAQFVSEDGTVLARFTDTATAIDSVEYFKPFERFEFGVNNSEKTYDFLGTVTNCNANFKKLVSVGGTNTIQNMVIEDKYAVGGSAGKVIFDRGVRLNQYADFAGFVAGDKIELEIVKGSYFYDPTAYCNSDYAGNRRYAPVGDFTGYYVIYPNSECEVTVVESGNHPVHYKTLQDAFDLAPDGSTIQLFNNGEMNASLDRKVSFTLTQDANGAAGEGADLITNSQITVAYGSLTVSNLTFRKSQIVVNAGAKLIAGDDMKMDDAENGAVYVKDGGQFVLNGMADISGNNGKNVVLENAATGFHLITRGDISTGYAKIGITCTNKVAGTQFGTVDADHQMAEGTTKGDNSGAPIFCDADPTLRVAKGAAIGDPVEEGTNSFRFIQNYTMIRTEGKYLVPRVGNELIWVKVPNDQQPVQPPLFKVIEGTYRTGSSVTLEVTNGVSIAGRDFAAVYDNGVTNWVSVTKDAVGVNGYMAWRLDDDDSHADRICIASLRKNEQFKLFSRLSITTDSTMSVTTISDERYMHTGHYDALDIARGFSENAVWLEIDKTTTPWITNDVAGVEGYFRVSINTDAEGGNFGNGYMVFFERDLGHGAVVSNDMGRLELKMNRRWINAKSGAAITIGEGCPGLSDEDDRVTRLFINNKNAAGKVGILPQDVARIVGARGEDGTETIPATDGSIGIVNTSAKKIYLDLGAGVEVYGGNGGNGHARTNVNGDNGANGADAIRGDIDITIDGALVKGGNGGNGGDSTYHEGGNGGNGGRAIGSRVRGTIYSGTIIGGDGGDAGAGRTAGRGGNGGIGFSKNSMIVQGNDDGSDIYVAGGKGGISTDERKNGKDGAAGKPSAPDAPKVKAFIPSNHTITVVLTNLVDDCEYRWYKKGEVPPKNWTEDLYNGNSIRYLSAGEEYVVQVRLAATDENQASFISELEFKTPAYTRNDVIAIFDNCVKIEKYDDVDGIVLTQTKDITHGIRLPDDLGKITLYMNGFSITGMDGDEPGVDGQPAILFVQNGSGMVECSTELVITGNGDNEIRGGNGADAYDVDEGDAPDGGHGGAGICADGTGERCKVVLVKGSVRGGNGGKGGDANHGQGGEGGLGGDAIDISDTNTGVDFEYKGGKLYGGIGGNGGDTYDNQAGNGGNGGDAPIAGKSEGGAGGMGGIATNGDVEKDGQPGEGGEGVIPGGPAVDYLVKAADADGENEKFFTSLYDAFAGAKKNQMISIFRDCKLDEDIEVVTDGLTLETTDGAKLTWTRDLTVAADITFTIAEEINAKVTGSLIVEGEVTQKSGSLPSVFVEADGVFNALAGEVEYVEVADSGRFVVPGETEATIGSIIADNKYDVLLFGGKYTADPSEYVRAPFEVVGEDPWYVRPNNDYVAMAVIDNTVTPLTDLDKAFEFLKNKQFVEVYLLKDATARMVYSDQDTANIVIYGFGRKIIDARTGEATESALFNLSGNLICRDVTFDGQGTQAGQFVRVFDNQAAAKFYDCQITGYKCYNDSVGAMPLISGSSAGEGTAVVLVNTEITGNDVSCAVDTTDSSDGSFRYVVHVGGSTTITDNGGYGIYSDGYGQIAMIDDLTGGYIDVYYGGYTGDRKFALAASSELKGVEHFRYSDERFCGALVTEGDQTYVRWLDDDTQYAAVIVSADDTVTNRYVTINEAFENVYDGCVLVVMQNANIEESCSVAVDGEFTLDLYGKTLTDAGNKLKFVSGVVNVKNGTFAAAKQDKYALYVNGATVYLGTNTVVAGDIYVSRGNLKVTNEKACVQGIITQSNRGRTTITAGHYVADPTAFLPNGYAAYPDTDPATAIEGYNWRVDKGVTSDGFARGFEPKVEVAEDGNITITVNRESDYGQLREGGTITFNGDVTDKITVTPVDGWKSTVSYANGKTSVAFSMDAERCHLIYGNSDDPGKRPLEIDTASSDTKVNLTMRIQNGVRGLWYQIVSAKNGDFSTWEVLTSKQATTPGNVELSIKNHTKVAGGEFFRVTYSDRKLSGSIPKEDLKY